ncbi:MAG: hypothetical protein ACR2LG_12000 [Actinomycetota bacterium]
MSYAGYGAHKRDVKMGRAFAAFLVSMTALLVVPAFNEPSIKPVTNVAQDRLPVIVRTTRGATGAAEQAVIKLGGRVGRDLALVDGFVARVPERAISELRAVPGVASLTFASKVGRLP